ncbi:aspartic proteinase nepenthesin-2 [Carex littledalei]|uniref:Aspartic proteinase nepenthesin-2 n=1 Tax=Carex littledalei TaxID=544730 RepID=A0A833VZP6_9POAL|nr:aspartic proteinase nepenthesin-2 [Carex littledalei]
MVQRMVSISTLFLLLSLFNLSHSLPDGLRTELIHVDAGRNYTKFELLQRMVQRSKTRRRYLASSDVTIPSFPSSGEYLINISIGTPAQPFVLTLDTGSDLVWTQCLPLIHYFNQSYPFFNPQKSSTFFYTPCEFELCNEIDISQPKCSTDNLCEYNSSYGDGSYTSGLLGKETFTLGAFEVTNMFFGCGNDNKGIFLSNECGIAGFGRGNLSLVSQLGYGKFAYCFTSFGESKSSPVLFGSSADLTRFEIGKIQSTPLLLNPIYTSYYYLTLNSITVGAELLQIPESYFAVNRTDGSGGVIIDSGTSLTHFPNPVYEMVKSAFMSQVDLPVVPDQDLLCFDLTSTSLEEFQPPRFIFHFDGADFELPPQNYMELYPKTTICLAMLSHRDPLTIIGNFQQQNFHVLYDILGEELSFVRAQCDRL